MNDILFIRNKCDQATEYTHWIGNGLKAFIESKGHTVTELSDAQATPENVSYWLSYNNARVKKAIIAFDHGSNDAFYGEKNNQCTAVITKNNVEDLTKGLHVYTYACSTNVNNGLGQTAIAKGCRSWLGYTEPVYVLGNYQPLKDCIWSYIIAMVDGKTMEQCEAALRKAYSDRKNLHWVFNYNLQRLLLRKKQNNTNINQHYRVVTFNNKKITGLWAYGPHKNNAYVYVQGMGWKKLWNKYDSQTVNMMSQAAHAKINNRFVNFEYEDSKIKRLEVW